MTIGGESAGGLSVCILNISPKAKGLFKKAAIFSGSCNGPWGVRVGAEVATESGLAVIKSFEMPENTLGELRKVDADLFLKLKERPVPVDNMVLKQALFNEAVTVSNAEEGIMIGNTNLDALAPFYLEAGLLPDETEGNKNSFTNRLKYYDKVSQPGDFLEVYKTRLGVTALEKKDVPAAYAMLNSDVCLVCAARTFAKEVASLNKGPVYLYEYGKNAGSTAYADAGTDREFALHAEDLVYTIGQDLDWAPPPFGPWKLTDTTFQTAWQGYMFSFIKSAGGDSTTPIDGTVDWPAYDIANPKHLFAGKTIEERGDLHKDACDLIDALSAETRFGMCVLHSDDFKGKVYCKMYMCKSGSHITNAETTLGFDEATCCESSSDGNTTRSSNSALGTKASLLLVSSMCLALLFC